jgi:diaminohydroxyphosphoribosylaminopyrimidine deaminase / 5-amino-6-(5-phosphoribosylamino)uracil reductase
MPADSSDDHLLRRALDMARQGVGLASPNPHVGAVIVDLQSEIVGEGVYTYQGVNHAEVLALQEAGESARGGTLYINLEPHAHQGRTSPCTDALIAAGIRRVVASMPDPNPKVSGSGFRQLREAGIQVEVGGLRAEARHLNEAFARYTRHGIPFVTLKSAMTLDGKIAPYPSSATTQDIGVPEGGWITGVAARAHVHEQRHAIDAIMVGVGTVLADDPLLTDRSGKPRRRPVLRVVLDSHLRLPLRSRLVRNASENNNKDLLICYCSDSQNKRSELERLGILVEQFASSVDGRPDFHQILRHLGQLEITSMIIEGGSTVNGAALAAGLADKVFLYYGSKIMAESGSVPFARSTGSTRALEVKNIRLHRFGEDFGVEGYFRDPYAD